MKVIGLMGGSGSGKSTIGAVFAKCGAVVVSADAVYHELLKTNASLLREIEANFGAGVVKAGKLDRVALAKIVFADDHKLQALDGITHPRITQEIRRRMQQAEKQGAPAFVIDAPLLYKTPLLSLCSEVILVRCDRQTRIKRIMQRDGISQEAARARIDAQPSEEELLKYATRVVPGNLPEKEIILFARGVFH